MNRSNPHGWTTFERRGRCTRTGLHRCPVPTTHVVKWPFLGLRTLRGEPLRVRAYLCAGHARQAVEQAGSGNRVRAFRYRTLPERPELTRLAKEFRRYLDAVDRVVDAIPEAQVQAALEQTLADAGYEVGSDVAGALHALQSVEIPFTVADPEVIALLHGWCAPAEATCSCGATAFPHNCPHQPPPDAPVLDLYQPHVQRGGLS